LRASMKSNSLNQLIFSTAADIEALRLDHVDQSATFASSVSATDGLFSGVINAESNGSVGLNVIRDIAANGNTSIRFRQLLGDAYIGVNPSGDFAFKDGADLSSPAFKVSRSGAGNFASSVSATDGIFSGDLFIGVTAIPSSSVYGSAFITQSNGRRVLYQSSSVATSSTIQAFYNSNGLVGTIATSGSGTSYNTLSDYRLKEDLKDFNGLEMISNIAVYDHKWKVDDSRSYSVLAHELQKVLPQAVSGEKDATEEYEASSEILDLEGNVIKEAVIITRAVHQGVDYSKIVPLLIKSIQELTAKVKILENK
jgi:hypothetical protein